MIDELGSSLTYEIYIFCSPGGRGREAFLRGSEKKTVFCVVVRNFKFSRLLVLCQTPRALNFNGV